MFNTNHSLLIGDQKGITPLMIACKLGRAGNVELIVKEQQRLLSSNEED